MPCPTCTATRQPPADHPACTKLVPVRAPEGGARSQAGSSSPPFDSRTVDSAVRATGSRRHGGSMPLLVALSRAPKDSPGRPAGRFARPKIFLPPLTARPDAAASLAATSCDGAQLASQGRSNPAVQLLLTPSPLAVCRNDNRSVDLGVWHLLGSHQRRSDRRARAAVGNREARRAGRYGTRSRCLPTRRCSSTRRGGNRRAGPVMNPFSRCNYCDGRAVVRLVGADLRCCSTCQALYNASDWDGPDLPRTELVVPRSTAGLLFTNAAR